MSSEAKLWLLSALAGFAHLLVELDSVRPEGGDKVEGCGQQRLEHAALQRRGLVHGPAAGHLGDGRGGGASPRAQVRGETVSGEQFSVADEIDDDLGRGPAGRRAELADHDVVAVADVSPAGQVFLAAAGVDVLKACDTSLGEPVQEAGQLDEPAAGGAEVQGGAVSAGQ